MLNLRSMSEAKIFTIEGKELTSAGGAKVEWKAVDFFEIRYKNKRFHGEIIEQNLEGNTLKVKINHRIIEVKRKYPLQDLIEKLGLDKPKVKKLKKLPSPMPGRVLKILVSVGDSINPGDSLMSLEAMKMENILKSDGEGVVKEITVAEQQVVEKGESLIEFQ